MAKMNHYPTYRLFCLLVTLAGFTSLLVTGCGKPPITIHKYILDYPPPAVPRQVAVPDALKVELFSVAQAINSPDMVYSPRAFATNVYRYHRWRVNPGYLVTDYLLRDLREAKLFQAVFPYESPVKSRFVLEGGVEDFQEVNEGDIWTANLGVNITLLDTTQTEIPRKVLLQKNYRAAANIVEKNPKGLAEAMSRAMEKVSGEIITDIHRAALHRSAARDK